VARKRLEEIETSPGRVIGGKALKDKLDELLS
jgi:hypothetical protein